MIDYSNASFSASVADEILSRALEYENNAHHIDLPDIPHFTMEQLLESGEKAGLNFKSIEIAVDSYFAEQVIRRTNLTKTRITEERVLESEADQLEIWQQVLSELSYRLSGKPAIQIFDNKENRWKLTDRSGNDTIIKLHKQGKKVKLILSKKISYFGPKKESFLAGLGVAAIIAFYLFVFLPTSITFNLTVFVGFSAILFFVIRRILEKISNRKVRQFGQLAEQITDQIPRFKSNREAPSENETETEPDDDSLPLFSIRKAFTKRDTRF